MQLPVSASHLELRGKQPQPQSQKEQQRWWWTSQGTGNQRKCLFGPPIAHTCTNTLVLWTCWVLLIKPPNQCSRFSKSTSKTDITWAIRVSTRANWTIQLWSYRTYIWRKRDFNLRAQKWRRWKIAWFTHLCTLTPTARPLHSMWQCRHIPWSSKQHRLLGCSQHGLGTQRLNRWAPIAN